MNTTDPIACALCHWGVVCKNTKYAECHINPPIASRDDSDAWWPIVEVEEWCGSFECDVMYSKPMGDEKQIAGAIETEVLKVFNEHPDNVVACCESTGVLAKHLDELTARVEKLEYFNTGEPDLPTPTNWSDC